MTTNCQALYLDLMKKVLSFSLWPEPPIPVETVISKRSAAKRALVWILLRLLSRTNLELAQKRLISTDEREDGRVWPAYADTMIGLKRLDNLQYCIESVIKDGIQGDLIETGVWRGGACIFMRAVLAAYGIKDRRVIVADSFQGLPKPDCEKWPADYRDLHHANPYLAATEDVVRNNFRKYGLLDEQVFFLKGWFEDTLPNAPIDRLSILRLDGDMYGSTMVALNSLYPKLSNGGYCIIDDYALRGCRMAVDDYRSQHSITSEMEEVDWTARFWRKE